MMRCKEVDPPFQTYEGPKEFDHEQLRHSQYVSLTMHREEPMKSCEIPCNLHDFRHPFNHNLYISYKTIPLRYFGPILVSAR